MTVSRRVFLRTLAATAGPWLLDARRLLAPRAGNVLRVGLVGGAGPAFESAARGASMGVSEARRVASLIGGDVELVRHADVQDLLALEDLHVLLGGFDEASCRALSAAAEDVDRLFLNLDCTTDRLRGEGCRRRTFHIAASDAMRRDALASAPDGRARSVELWHGSLVRYGAAQLNDRFRAEYDRPMDSAAWSGWMAVKIAWEAFARVRPFETVRIVEWLESERTRFDGHKGRALSFRPWDHQLRQPLYVVGGASPEPVEVPPIVRGTGPAVAEQLDVLGTRAGETACRWSIP